MISYGLSATASTRVVNELGAGNPHKAKRAMVVTLKLSVLFAFVVDLALVFCHNAWASLFSDSSEIINKFASMTPLLLISFVLDFIHGILSGVTRGCGWQHLGMFINLATFYFIGMPIASFLAFKFILHAQFEGAVDEGNKGISIWDTFIRKGRPGLHLASLRDYSSSRGLVRTLLR